jgi:hypothetical protein
MLKIKLSFPSTESNIDISQFVGNLEGYHQNCQFYVNNSDVDKVDFWFVIDDLQLAKEHVIVSPDNVYFLTAEHVHEMGYYSGIHKSMFLDQFSKIFTSYDVFQDNALYDIPFLGWMINANHGPSINSKSSRDVNWLKKLSNLKKTRKISVFCSQKTFTPEHQARYKFVEILKKHFGDELDWYGNGVRSIPQKWDAIAPYKYHIVLENQSRHNIISEKIYDSYLGLAYPIYWGAPNLSDYFPEESFTPIEILDWRGAIKVIEDVLVKDEWEKKLPSLIKAKQIVTNDLNLFSRLVGLANKSNYALGSSEKKLVVLSSINSHLTNSISLRFLNNSAKVLKRVHTKLMDISN